LFFVQGRFCGGKGSGGGSSGSRFRPPAGGSDGAGWPGVAGRRCSGSFRGEESSGAVRRTPAGTAEKSRCPPLPGRRVRAGLPLRYRPPGSAFWRRQR
jgi:hypothetical protein